MDYLLITEVTSIRSCDCVNKYLNAGWVLLNIYNSAYRTADPRTVHQEQNFTLGWPGNNPKHPELNYDYDPGNMEGSL